MTTQMHKTQILDYPATFERDEERGNILTFQARPGYEERQRLRRMGYRQCGSDGRIWQAIPRVDPLKAMRYISEQGGIVIPSPAPSLDPVRWGRLMLESTGVERLAVRMSTEGDWVVIEVSEEGERIEQTERIEEFVGRDGWRERLWSKAVRELEEGGHVFAAQLVESGITLSTANELLRIMESEGLIRLTRLTSYYEGKHHPTYGIAPRERK